jgi:L-lactate dehydrogenase complex protein LldF
MGKPITLFKARATGALADKPLQSALAELPTGLAANRAKAKAGLPEFEALRETARAIKDHALSHLDHYLDAFEASATKVGSKVHWASTPEEARQAILAICKDANARLVTKGKSMVSEEIGLNHALEAAGMEVVETDLGEYLIQLEDEAPSHIIAPAIHLTIPEIERRFRVAHTHLDPARTFPEAADIVAEARAVLRQKFLSADVGITGANFIIADTGSSIIVTNEGNGDLTQLLPKVHIVITAIDKVLPTLNDAAALMRLLPRSATGQEATSYTTFTTGPRRNGEAEGPEEVHIVILDNGRTELLASEMRPVLRCIRCGACMNHCPVYGAIGGHAYGAVIPGPIGAALMPGLTGVSETAHLAGASTFCGACSDVCPVKIPLTDMMRHWREAEFEQGQSSWAQRKGLQAWAALANRPGAYHLTMRFAVAILGALGRRRGAFRWLPFAGGWTRHRDLPAPEGRTFQQLWQEHSQGVPR